MSSLSCRFTKYWLCGNCRSTKQWEWLVKLVITEARTVADSLINYLIYKDEIISKYAHYKHCYCQFVSIYTTDCWNISLAAGIEPKLRLITLLLPWPLPLQYELYKITKLAKTVAKQNLNMLFSYKHIVSCSDNSWYFRIVF